MAKIYVFRHGQTTYNLKHRFCGWIDADLTESGIEEAKKIGEKLKNERVTRAYCSDQIRSKHTLELVLNGYHKDVPVFEDPRIKERDYGDLTGKNKDEVEKENPGQYKLWHRSYDVPPPNGESIKDVEKRVMKFLNELIPTIKKDDVIFISAHGNSLRPIRKHFEGLSNEEMSTFEHERGHIYCYNVKV